MRAAPSGCQSRPLPLGRDSRAGIRVRRAGMPLLAIALPSAGLLPYEVLLTRLFSIVQWHHFAYMIISIALLGYGASGTFLAFVQDRLRRHVASVFALCAPLFAITG